MVDREQNFALNCDIFDWCQIIAEINLMRALARKIFTVTLAPSQVPRVTEKKLDSSACNANYFEVGAYKIM